MLRRDGKRRGTTADSWKQRIWLVRRWGGVRGAAAGVGAAIGGMESAATRVRLPGGGTSRGSAVPGRSAVGKPRLRGGAGRPSPAQQSLAQAEGVGIAHVVDPAADGGVEGVGDCPPAIAHQRLKSLSGMRNRLKPVGEGRGNPFEWVWHGRPAFQCRVGGLVGETG